MLGSWLTFVCLLLVVWVGHSLVVERVQLENATPTGEELTPVARN